MVRAIIVVRMKFVLHQAVLCLLKCVVVAELKCIQAFVHSVCRHKLLVSAALGYPSVHYNGNLVGVTDS